MKVGLVTSWTDRCGLSECSRNIVKNVPGVEFKIIEPNDRSMFDGSRDCDLVHISYEFNLHTITPQGIRSLQKPTMMTYFNSNQDNNINELTTECSKIVVLEPSKDDDPRVVYIPMAIPEGCTATGEPENLVGTIGFPFPWKCMPEIAAAAYRVGMGFIGIMPTHPWMDTMNCMKEQQKVRAMNPQSEVYTEWLEFDEVMQQLNRCKVLVFAHRPNDFTSGISSATRYGLATGRPIVMTRFTMYRDLFPYNDEIYFTSMNASELQLSEIILLAAEGKHKPKRLLKDFGWKAAGEKYLDIYKGLLAS